MKGELLAGFELLRDFESEELDALCDLLERRELSRGAILFEEGDPAEGLVLVAEGTLRVKRLQVGSLGEVGPGQSIGASSLTSAGPREATVVAPSGACIYVLSRDAFRSLAQVEPQVAFKLASAALRELADTVRGGLSRILSAPG